MQLQTPEGYRFLDEEDVKAFVAALPSVRQRLGEEPAAWSVGEVGDGNLNLVFLVDGPDGSCCVKQSLPYVRLVGPDWPMPLERAFFEHECMVDHGRHVGRLIPEVYHYDPEMFAIVMEKLSPHIIMRRGMIDGVVYPKFAEDIAEYCAQTLFKTSTLFLPAEAVKQRVAVFAGNTELCRITEDLIFTDPYRANERNRWTSPQLDPVKAAFEADTELKLAISRLKLKFMGSTEALLHGDLHTGSVMLTPDDTRIIDPEFAFYGPRGFDLGAVIGNLLINFFAQDGHAAEGRPSETPRAAYQAWVLETIEAFWAGFRARFIALWEAEGKGDGYPHDLFADEAGRSALAEERERFMDIMLHEALGFAGAKMIRRILGLAHNIDLEWIEDPDIRAKCERKCLSLARELVLETGSFNDITAVTRRAREVAAAAG
ncbi:MAG: S-methyl-5-thioribose kinase [Pseudomonadota bacterium]